MTINGSCFFKAITEKYRTMHMEFFEIVDLLSHIQLYYQVLYDEGVAQ